MSFFPLFTHISRETTWKNISWYRNFYLRHRIFLLFFFISITILYFIDNNLKINSLSLAVNHAYINWPRIKKYSDFFFIFFVILVLFLLLITFYFPFLFFSYFSLPSKSVQYILSCTQLYPHFSGRPVDGPLLLVNQID